MLFTLHVIIESFLESSCIPSHSNSSINHHILEPLHVKASFLYKSFFGSPVWSWRGCGEDQYSNFSRPGYGSSSAGLCYYLGSLNAVEYHSIFSTHPLAFLLFQ
ncbi:hypothetical protein O181_041961 [Austropuccinia psidii MF-1]|uniref:Uncharacterized protein n=1 Tax=Austropuccinia psidii MF-1 TaxID=1389203 RepID=A0A9Q3DDZ3_9BASI|nr:hypothetical protein [Austropuccinia psidii MF-1]